MACDFFSAVNYIIDTFLIGVSNKTNSSEHNLGNKVFLMLYVCFFHEFIKTYSGICFNIVQIFAKGKLV